MSKFSPPYILLAWCSRCLALLVANVLQSDDLQTILLSRRNQAHCNQPHDGPFITFRKSNDSLKWIFELETISLQPSLIATYMTLIILNITSLKNRSWHQHRSQTTYIFAKLKIKVPNCNSIQVSRLSEVCHVLNIWSTLVKILWQGNIQDNSLIRTLPRIPLAL